MSVGRFLLILSLYSVLETYGRDIYLITTPSALLSDARHIFNVYVSTNVAMVIETVHLNSKITNRSDLIILKKGHQSISYFVPFIDRQLEPIELRFLGDNCSSVEICQSTTKVDGRFINESRDLDILMDNFIIFSETDKPIYKPADVVKLRMMALHPTNLRLEPPSAGPYRNILFVDGKYHSVVAQKNQLSTFDSITIETPDNIKMAQWLNVSFDDAMRLVFRLSNDPILGKWTINTVMGSQKETIHFTVSKYVLPRFVVELQPPSVILLSDKNISVKVCASYSTGKNMQASIRGELCITTKRNICQTFASNIDGRNKCNLIFIDGTSFGLGGTERIYYSSLSRVRITVTEQGTTHEVTKIASGSSIKLSSYEIKFLSKDYFKPGLPYFGKVKLVRHDGSPQPKTKIEISIDSFLDSKWGFKGNYTSNDDGVIDFIIPYIQVKSSLTINFYGNEKSNSIMEAPTLYQRLTNWESVDNEYLVIAPIEGTIKCPGKLELKLLMNGDISAITVYTQTFSRGVLNQMIEHLPVPVKCVDRNDYLGHYKCDSNNQLKCLDGWKGDNCREPVCKAGCFYGACLSPNICVCKSGWTGSTCKKCVATKYCINGFCKYGNDCVCLPGWSGYRCELRGPKIHKYRDTVIPALTTEAPKPESLYQNKTIFERIIEIPFDTNMGPDLHIMIYYINSGGEVVTDSIEIKDGLKNCSHLGGGIFEFSDKTSSPGNTVQLFLDPGTGEKRCALRISDIALSQFGQSSNINLDHLIDKLIKLNHKITKLNDNQNICLPKGQIRLSKYVPSFGQGYDGRKSFSQSGMMPITNARLLNAICIPTYILPEYTFYLSYQKLGQSGPDEIMEINKVENVRDSLKEEVVQVKKEIRDFFPETWIFDYYNVTPSHFNLITPDSMTTWRATSFCMTEKGIWMAPTRSLTVVLPFFADIYTPYSIKMGERLQLPVKLFNYVNDCYEIRAEVKVNNSEIKISGPRSFTVCVCSNDVKTIYFSLTATIIGKLNVTVTTQSQYSSFCSNGTKQNKTVNLSDSIRRQLLVEPPGIQSETTFSELICNNNEELGLKASFKIPSKIVPGSLRTYLVYNGDAMGQTFDNLDKLVRMPYGCGEQNMVALVPSIYVLNYLTNLRINDPVLVNKAKEYIVNGYQRQLTYKHVDGSYSAFGKNDQSGNTWLTAFVLKSFSDASKYVTIIDRGTLQESAQYLAKMQRPNGCFEERGKLLSSTMAGGLKNKGKTDDSLLTAYVLISLQNITAYKSIFNIAKAIDCVKSGLKGNKLSAYRLALSGYSLSIHDPHSTFTISIIEQLNNASTSSGRYKYWRSGLDSTSVSGVINSADVETTGYALLALSTYQSLPESLRTVYWLSNQRTSLGGYYSTQDTIVALNAISVLAERIGATPFKEVSLGVVLNNNIKHNDTITHSNRLVTRKVNMGSQNISYIDIKTSGTGCLSIQLISLFNIFKLFAADEYFKIDVTAEFTNEKLCTVLEIKVCSSYLRTDQDSNMILITVDFPSGWELNTAEMNELLRQIITPLKRIDFEKNKIHLYYDSFSYAAENNLRCLTFRLDEMNKIDNLKPSFVRMVDYYKPEIYTDLSYTVPIRSCVITNTSPSKPPVDHLCPICANDSDKSIYDVQSNICPWSFVGLVMASNTTVTNRVFYESKEKSFHEWSVDLTPTNCSCLQSWRHVKENFVVISSQWIWLNEKLSFTNTSFLFPSNVLYRAFQSDLGVSCSSANQMQMMMMRLFPDFENRTKVSANCSSCILLSNLNYKVTNISTLLCSKNPRWSLNIDSINNSRIIHGSLSNRRNETIFVEATFPMTLCFCLRQLQDLKKSFEILDLNNTIKAMNYTADEPLKLVLDGRFTIVESAVFSRYRQSTRCII